MQRLPSGRRKSLWCRESTAFIGEGEDLAMPWLLRALGPAGVGVLELQAPVWQCREAPGRYGHLPTAAPVGFLLLCWGSSAAAVLTPTVPSRAWVGQELHWLWEVWGSPQGCKPVLPQGCKPALPVCWPHNGVSCMCHTCLCSVLPVCSAGTALGKFSTLFYYKDRLCQESATSTTQQVRALHPQHVPKFKNILQRAQRFKATLQTLC